MIKSPLLIGLSLASILGIFLSISFIRKDRALGLMSNEAARASVRIDQFENFADTFNSVPFVGSEIHTKLAREFKREASAESDPRKRVDLRCMALSRYGKALEKDPENSILLVSWANLRQMLGKYPCTMPLTEGKVSDVLERALSLDSTNPNILYGAALVSIWSGEEKRGDQMLRDFLELDTRPSAGQIAIISQFIDSPERFKRIVPARFPQIHTWSELMRAKLRRRFEPFKGEFSRMVLAAIKKSEEELSKKSIPSYLHQERLLSIGNLPLTDGIRKRSDEFIAKFESQNGNGELASYLSKRATLEDLGVTRGMRSGDTRTYKGMLYDFGSTTSLYFDGYFQSIGFYAGKPRRVRLIELRSDSNGAEISKSAIRVFVSEDNEQWEELNSVSIETFKLGVTNVYALSVAGIIKPYWKINFRESKRLNTFYGNLDSMLRVYGYSS